jgi:hypothetical protein
MNGIISVLHFPTKKSQILYNSAFFSRILIFYSPSLIVFPLSQNHIRPTTDHSVVHSDGY